MLHNSSRMQDGCFFINRYWLVHFFINRMVEDRPVRDKALHGAKIVHEFKIIHQLDKVRHAHAQHIRQGDHANQLARKVNYRQCANMMLNKKFRSLS